MLKRARAFLKAFDEQIGGQIFYLSYRRFF
jgi:hypothetical protein